MNTHNRIDRTLTHAGAPINTMLSFLSFKPLQINHSQNSVSLFSSVLHTHKYKMKATRKNRLLKIAEMVLIINFIFTSSNNAATRATARPLTHYEKPALVKGFKLIEIDRAPLPPAGPSRCTNIPGHNNHKDVSCPSPTLRP